MNEMHRFILTLRKYKLTVNTAIHIHNDYFFETIESELLRAIMKLAVGVFCVILGRSIHLAQDQTELF